MQFLTQFFDFDDAAALWVIAGGMLALGAGHPAAELLFLAAVVAILAPAPTTWRRPRAQKRW